MTFEEYLAGKKIDADRFREEEPDVWASWLNDFRQQHPASFTAQKLYLINPIRRRYRLKPSSEAGAAAPAETRPAGKAAARPVFKSKPKT